MSTSLRLFVSLLGFGLGAIGGTAILIAAYSHWPARMRKRLFLIGLGLAIVLLAVGGWTVQALRSLPGHSN